MTVTGRAGTNSSRMEFEPQQYALGAYVTGIDLTGLSDAAFAEIHQAWLDHLVIVIREQQLTDDDLTAFSARFGVLDEVPPVSTGQKPRDNRHVSVISNLLENGVPIGGLGDDEVIWHSDTSYRDCPPSASILHALEIPSAGGNTSFSNMYLALETLTPALRDRIDLFTVKNDTTYNAGGQLREGFAPVTDVRACPGATHPLVRTHPDTRRNALYLGRRRNAYIEGLEVEESEALLDTLWSHATQGHIANNFSVKSVSVISNLDPDGKLMSADDPRVQYRLGQRNWHSDSSFKRVPAKASLLHARMLPPDGGEIRSSRACAPPTTRCRRTASADSTGRSQFTTTPIRAAT